MARLKTSPAEAIWSAESWSRLSAGLEVVLDTGVTPQQGSGSYIVQGDGIQKNSWLGFTNGVSGGFLFFQWYVRLEDLLTSAGAISGGPFVGSSAPAGQLHCNASGQLDNIYLVSTFNDYPDPTPLTIAADTWVKVEMVVRNNPANTRRIEAFTWINNVFFCKSTVGSSTLAGEITRFFASAASGQTPKVNIDDIKINDESGGSDNFFPSGVHPVYGTAPSPGGAHTVPSIRTQALSGTGSAANASSFAATAPGTIVAGDLLTAVIVSRSNSVTVTGPAGWTKKLDMVNLPGSFFRVTIWQKVAAAGDVGASTYTWSGSGAVEWSAHLASVQNAISIGDADVHGASAAGTVATTPSLYDHNGDCLAMFGICAFKSASNITLTGYPGANDQLAFDDPGATNFQNVKVGTRQQVAGGFSKGDGTSTLSTATSEGHVGWQFLIQPSIGPTPPTIGQMWPRGWKDTSSPTTGQLFPRRVIA